MGIAGEIMLFSLKSFVFSGVVVFLGMTLAWILYKFLILRGISLKEALFEKNNFSAWLEFVGAFLLPIFFLSAKVIDGEIKDTFTNDLLYGIVYVLSFTLAFTVLRIVCGWIVHFITGSDEHGKVDLIKEVYNQNNTAAALFSISFAMVILNILYNIKMVLGNSLVQLSMNALLVLIFTILFTAFYFLISKKDSILKEIFIDNNVAAGINVLGFMIAIQIILYATVNYFEATNLIDSSILCLIAFVILMLIVTIIRAFFSKIIKFKLSEQLFNKNNYGLALADACVFIGVALVIANYF